MYRLVEEETNISETEEENQQSQQRFGKYVHNNSKWNVLFIEKDIHTYVTTIRMWMHGIQICSMLTIVDN